MKYRSDYNPDQPRDEGGDGGGQWVAEGGGGGTSKSKGSKSSKGSKAKSAMSPELEKAARERAAKIGISDPSPKELAHFAKKIASEKGAAAPAETTKPQPKELSKSARGKDFREQDFKAVAKSGGDPALAEHLYAEWATESDSEVGVQLRAAIATLSGKPVDGAIARMLSKHPDKAKAWEKSAKEFVKDKKAMATVRAMMKASQSAHKDEGDTVTLFRGISGAQAEQLRKAAESGESIKLGADSIASFTQSINDAQVFAENGGVVVEMKVPRSSIVMSHKASGGVWGKGEEEVLVATKGSFKVKPGQVHTKKAETTAKGATGKAFDDLVAKHGLAKALELAERSDYDDDQPRDESGRWTAGGGGGSGGGGASKKASHATWRAAKTKGAESSHKAVASLIDRPRHFAGARSKLEASVEHRGLTPIPMKNGTKAVGTSKKLDGTGTMGTHHALTGKITLSAKMADNVQAFAERWHKDPEWERERHENLPKLLRSDDPLEREGAQKIAAEMTGIHTLVHETVHGYGPIHAEDIEGSGVTVEEVTTEMIARAHVKEDFGYDLHAVREASSKDVIAGYQERIDATRKAIIEVYEIPYSAAQHVLEHASIAFKQLPRPPRSYNSVYNARSAYNERLRSAKYNNDEKAIAEAQGLLDKLPSVVPPIELFAQTIDAVFDKGPAHEGDIEVKASERAKKLNEELQRKWSKWM